MEKQIRLISSRDWKNLIVLDACRYDYFEKIHENFFQGGSLKKVHSPASNTIEWCKNTFTEKYQKVVYVSTNPYINSVTEVKGFNAKKYFSEIFDVWKDGWNTQLGTVHPKTVNKAVAKAKSNYPKKRLIIHYLQPHGPYLPLGYMGSDVAGRKFGYGRSKKRYYRIIDFLKAILEKTIGKKMLWKLKCLFSLPPTDPIDPIIKRFGGRGLKKLYMMNLKIVLKYVKQILKKLDGETIITADHGELLGENGLFGHPGGLTHSKLITVPWFEAIDLETTPETSTRKGKRNKIKKRLTDLKRRGKI